MPHPKAPAYQREKNQPKTVVIRPANKRVAQTALTGTEQQVKFLEEWAKGNSPGAAALRAGYAAPSYGYELAKNPLMLEKFAVIKRKYEEAMQTSREKVMGMFDEAFQMAKLQAEPMAMVAAAREIGKMCGYYAPIERHIKIEGNVVLDKMNKLSDAELLELVGHANGHIANVVQQLEDDHDHDSPALAGPAAGHSGHEVAGAQAPGSEDPNPHHSDPREADPE